MQRLKLAAGKLHGQAKQLVASIFVGQAQNIGLALQRASVGLLMAITETDPLGAYMASGPSLFCSCCGERWHAFSHAHCPNGCPWVFTSFRAPAWAEDEELLRAVQEHHRGQMILVDGEHTPQHTMTRN